MGNEIMIRDFVESDIEYIVNSHNGIYYQEYGLDHTFHEYVADAVYKFRDNHEKGKENIWIAEVDGKPVGSIALVKVDDKIAQLRWFLLEQEVRGKGLGHNLITTVIDFAKENNYKQIMLWTINILEAAHHLYQSYGFTLTESNALAMWGKNLVEERWDLIFD